MLKPIMKSKRGFTANIQSLIGIVVVLVLIGALAVTALVPLFNATAFTDVPAWVPTVLGILGVVAFIFVILKVAK